MRVWKSIPNFVDTELFRPAADAVEKRECKRLLGIPEDASVIGCVAAVKKDHKRIDYLIREFANLIVDHCPPSSALRPLSSVFSPPPFLVIAGGRERETDEVIKLAEELAPGRVKILLDLPRERMPELYRAMDLFVIASLFEMMPIAVLEALASGLPVIANSHPVLQWMIGEGGVTIEMGRAGALADALGAIKPDWLASRGRAARERALSAFSKEAVIEQYIDFYEEVMSCDK